MYLIKTYMGSDLCYISEQGQEQGLGDGDRC